MPFAGISAEAPLEIPSIFVAAGNRGNDSIAGRLYSKVTSAKKSQDVPLVIFEKFLKSRWTEKETTLSETVELLGKPHLDLDRPKQDQVKAVQWGLNGPPGGLDVVTLHADFEPKPPHQLVKYGLGRAICGFCPHILSLDESDQWRLEGKMLAGRIGQEKIGSDILILPRLGSGEEISVQIANIAPETEFISQVEIAKVSLADGEQLDVSNESQLTAWRPLFEKPLIDNPGKRIPIEDECRLLVFEIRNNSDFEMAMREHYLDGKPEPELLNLTLNFGTSTPISIEPVGTKFLKRVLVFVPPNSSSIQIANPLKYWDVRRVWGGVPADKQPDIQWISPRNRESLILPPNTARTYIFDNLSDSSSNVSFAIRARGYYEFLFPEN